VEDAESALARTEGGGGAGAGAARTRAHIETSEPSMQQIILELPLLGYVFSPDSTKDRVDRFCSASLQSLDGTPRAHRRRDRRSCDRPLARHQRRHRAGVKRAGRHHRATPPRHLNDCRRGPDGLVRVSLRVLSSPRLRVDDAQSTWGLHTSFRAEQNAPMTVWAPGVRMRPAGRGDVRVDGTSWRNTHAGARAIKNRPGDRLAAGTCHGPGSENPSRIASIGPANHSCVALRVTEVPAAQLTSEPSCTHDQPVISSDDLTPKRH
jgi:hypothetical protein